MASTRNRNTEPNYRSEMTQYRDSANYKLYENSSHGTAYDTRWAGNGLNPGQIPCTQLAQNAIDIESFLFGVGSTNMVAIASQAPGVTVSIRPELTALKQCNVYDSRETVVPPPMRHDPTQRPFCIP